MLKFLRFFGPYGGPMGSTLSGAVFGIVISIGIILAAFWPLWFAAPTTLFVAAVVGLAIMDTIHGNG